MTILLAILAGLLIGLSLGALGGGGSILAVPVLVYALGQSASQATTGSLVVVGVTSVLSAIAAYRAGNVLLARGVGFGLVAIAGAAVGAKASAHVSEPVLLAAFAVLMLVVGGVMAVRELRARGAADQDRHDLEELTEGAHQAPRTEGQAGGARVLTPPAESRSGRRHAQLDDPLITFSPTFGCRCPQALLVLTTATVVGLLTGFLGVGGGFLVVPALVLALALPMEYAAGTSLVVISLTSAAALVARAGAGVRPDWGLVLALTLASAAGGLVGARVAARTDTARLSSAFTVLVLAVAGYTAFRAFPALF